MIKHNAFMSYKVTYEPVFRDCELSDNKFKYIFISTALSNHSTLILLLKRMIILKHVTFKKNDNLKICHTYLKFDKQPAFKS